jgi:hypothetical protein
VAVGQRVWLFVGEEVLVAACCPLAALNGRAAKRMKARQPIRTAIHEYLFMARILSGRNRDPPINAF